MKKILLLVFLFVLGKMSYSQGYPLIQNLGSDSTIVVSKGALQSRLIPIVITDTNAANAQRLKSYPGAQLYTTAGDFYIRNSNATKWILVSSGSSGSVNIYTADGTLTGNRTLTGANNNLTFGGLNKFTVTTGDTTLFNTNTFGIKGVGGVLNVEGTAAGTTSSLTLKTASDGNWTISTGVAGLELGDLRFYDNDNGGGSARMIIKSTGKVGIGTETPDSMLSVAQGAYFGRGIIAPNLPSALGTKALRIDAQGKISVADTTIGGGTVIQVNTNDGSGITGGPITVSGTLAIDTTNVIATKLSVAGGLAGKLNISDTANMLKNYVNQVGYALTKVNQVVSADSATLSNYYLRRKDSLTATNSIGYVTKTVLADTAAAIRSSDAGGTVTSVATNNGTGITGGTITTSGTLAIDTLLISTRAWRQKGIDSVAALVGAGYVPYVGATDTLNMGQFGIKTKYLELDTSTRAVTNRTLQWSNDNGTLAFGMTNGGTIEQNIGLQQFARVRNVQGSQINKGQVVYLYGASGDRAAVKLADNRNDSTSSKTLGIAVENIANGGEGFVGTFGTMSGLNLSTYTPGDILYLDSIPGGLTATKPQAPYHLVFIGVVERANSGNGLLFTNPQNGYELEELHNVRITKPVRNNAILVYDSTASLWVDTTISQAGLAVTSVATNNGTGITGGTITTSGTLAIDTTIISTRAWRQKGVDSLQANINLKLNISDTTAMLANYVNNVGYGLSKVGQVVSADSSTLSNYYLRRKDSLTATNLLGYVTRTILADTAAAIRGSDAGGTVTSVATNTGTGITGGTITTSGTLAIDTLLISTRAWRQKGIDSVAALINSNVSGTTNYVPKFTGTNTLGNSIIFENPSPPAIGIGTTAPAFTLDVNGSGRFVNALTAASFNGVTNNIFTVSGNEGMRLTSTGLGIGTSSPAYKLDVSGDARLASSSSPSLFINNTSTNGKNYRLVSKDDGLFVIQQTGIADLLFLNTSGNLGLGVTPSAWNSSYRAIQIGNSGSIFSATGTGGDVYISSNAYLASGGNTYVNTNFASDYYQYQGQHIWRTAPSGTAGNTISFTQAMTLDASGNLGLGVTPSAWSTLKAFQINSQSSISADGTSTQISTNAYFDGSWKYIQTDEASNYYQLDGQHVWRTAPSGTAGNAISFTQAMTLDASGRLAIGRTTADHRLDIQGNELIRNTLGNASFYFAQEGDNSSTLYQYNNGTLKNIFSTNGSSYITGGNVGIGTTSPSEILDVRNSYREPTSGEFTQLISSTTTQDAGRGGSIGFGGYYSSTTSFTSFSGIKGAKENGDGGNTAGNLIFYTRPNAGAMTERMRITSGGEVYIAGTTDQGAYNLQVNGTGVWGAGAYVDGSDSALKRNIQPLGNSLEIIKQMRPVTFEYQPFYSKDTATQTGFIAQELQQLLADKVYKNGVVKEGGAYLGVAYQSIIPLLVQAVKELEAEVQSLKSQLNK